MSREMKQHGTRPTLDEIAKGNPRELRAVAFQSIQQVSGRARKPPLRLKSSRF
jgi:hypothetical protein